MRMKTWFAGTIGLATMCVLIVVAGSQEFEISESSDFWNGVAELYERLATDQITGIDDLILEYEWDQASILPIAPPSPDAPLLVGRDRIRLFLPSGFPEDFIKGLVPTQDENEDYVFYRVSVSEDPLTRNRMISASDGSVLAVVSAPFDYDPWWYLREYYGLYGEDSYSVAGHRHDGWLEGVYDPARIIGQFNLFTEEGLMALAYRRAPAEGEGGGMMMCGREGGGVSNLQIVAIEAVACGITELTIAWPTNGLSTNGVDFFACTNLMELDWKIALTTNIDLTTNCFSWIDTDSTNYPIRFYDCWTFDDSDSDGLSDGRETRIYETETDNWDTDGDGVGDGEEVENETDPLDKDDPPNVVGTVYYGGWRTGVLWVVAVTSSNSWSTNASISLTEAGEYQIARLSETNYWLKAYMDSDGDGGVSANEAWGVYSNGSLAVTAQVENVDITLWDPDGDGDGLGDWWEIKWFGSTNAQSGAGNPDGDEWNNEAEYLYGLNPTNVETAAGDEDGDGYMNIYEINHGTHCLRASGYPEPTVTVSPNGDLTIQQAIDQATNDYDIVMLFEGTYTNAGDRNLDFSGRKILLTSNSDATSTVINASGGGRGLYFHSSEGNHSVVSRLTICGGITNRGGGIYCASASPTILNCIISSNTVSEEGGGIAVSNAVAIVVDSCTIENNVASKGGGLYLDSSSGRITNCVVATCTATVFGGGGGGGVSMLGSGGMVVADCRIRDNACEGLGGGLHIVSQTGAVVDTLVTNNTALYGGGAYLGGLSAGQTNLLRCVFSNNTGTNSGGAVYAYNTSASISSCRLEHNTVAANGGGIHFTWDSDMRIENSIFAGNVAVNGGAFSSDTNSNPTIINCTVTENTAGSHGGGIIVWLTNSTPTVRNCVLWGNSASDAKKEIYLNYGDLNLYISNCDIEQAGYHGMFGNTTNPPLLWFDGRHLAGTNSPCYNAGSSSSAPGDDLDEESRPWSGSVDIGADEFVDTDWDHMPDWWESRYSGAATGLGAWADIDQDMVTNICEYLQGTDPTSNLDSDGDELSDDFETYIGTDPVDWDTDDDLMSDGWEVYSGLNPTNDADADADSDGDGLTNFWEYVYGACVTNTDTDGDGVTDATEVTQGSDPGDSSDEGNADNCISIELVVGDHSGSHSERYELQVGSSTIHHVATEFGVLATGTYSFVKGKSYPFEVKWIASNQSEPDYDYTAKIGGFSGSGTSTNGYVIDDPEGILGAHAESSYNFAAGKSGTLTIINVDIEKPGGDPESDSNSTNYWLSSPCYHWDFQGVSTTSPASYSLDVEGNIEPAGFNYGWTTEVASAIGTLTGTGATPTHNPPSTAPIQGTNGTITLEAMNGTTATGCKAETDAVVYLDHLARDYKNFGPNQSCNAGTWSTPFGPISMDCWNCHGSTMHLYDGSGDGDEFGSVVTSTFAYVTNCIIEYEDRTNNVPLSLARGDVIVYYNATYDTNNVLTGYGGPEHSQTALSGTDAYGANNTQQQEYPEPPPSTWKWYVDKAGHWMNQWPTNTGDMGDQRVNWPIKLEHYTRP